MTKTLQQLISMARECVKRVSMIESGVHHQMALENLKAALEALDKFDAEQKGEVVNG